MRTSVSCNLVTVTEGKGGQLKEISLFSLSLSLSLSLSGVTRLQTGTKGRFAPAATCNLQCNQPCGGYPCSSPVVGNAGQHHIMGKVGRLAKRRSEAHGLVSTIMAVHALEHTRMLPVGPWCS
jgi:hypothetical protein